MYPQTNCKLEAGSKLKSIAAMSHHQLHCESECKLQADSKLKSIAAGVMLNSND